MSQTLQERIRERAYHIWNGSGRPDGRDEQFWLQAEREILAETATGSVNTTTVPAVPAEEPAAPTVTAVMAVTAARAEAPAAKKTPKKAARLVAKAKAAAAKRTDADATPLVEATSIVPLPGQPAVPAAAKPAATLAAKAAPKPAAKSAAKPRLRAAR